MRLRFICMVLLFGLVAMPFLLFAGVPLDTVKSNVESVIDILKNPAFKNDKGGKEKREKIRYVSEKMFDFTELSKRTLGLNWNKFSEPQRKEFIDLYKSILENAYIEKITSYTDEKVSYASEVALSEKTVEVKTIILRKGGNVPVNYRLIKSNGMWKVYDVVVEGVSLVSNYRTQFREILSDQKPDQLITILRKKAEKK